jgi:hypothetical protein
LDDGYLSDKWRAAEALHVTHGSPDRTLDRIHHAHYVLCREQAGREASPTAAIIDSQSVKGAEQDPVGRRIAGRR